MDFLYCGEDLLDDLDSFEAEDSFEGIHDIIESNISFGSSAEKTLEYDLRQAQKNIDYYEREIRNFSDSTTETYRRNCLSHLEQAVKKANDIAEQLQKLQSK
ncbi:MAG: hypothetical protein IJE12_10045 [Prevotella sp.]|nr:hypothetical protein [Prevotella sp.]